MHELVFATNNAHKLSEIKKILEESYIVYGLSEKGIDVEIPEDHPTLRENALQKATYIHHHFGCDCFADDTGLEIDALGGEPGVYSARYSRIGEPRFPNMDVTEGNIRKVLGKLEGISNRQARFITVIALVIGGEQWFFEGSIEGHIAEKPSGDAGFGYDPLFVPEGFDRTFAEMDLKLKNQISHRAIAVQKLAAFLKKRSE